MPNATGSGTSTQCEFYYYGITGQRLETWSCGYNDSNGGDGSYWSSVKETYSYFGRRLIKINDWVAVDRLGSVRSTGSGADFVLSVGRGADDNRRRADQIRDIRTGLGTKRAGLRRTSGTTTVCKGGSGARIRWDSGEPI